MRAQKRGRDKHLFRWIFPRPGRRWASWLVDEQIAEEAFEKRWALTLLQKTLARLRREYADRGRSEVFDQFKATLIEQRGSVRYPELAVTLGTSEASVKMAVHRLRQRKGVNLREENSETVCPESEVEDKLREVFRALSH